MPRFLRSLMYSQLSPNSAVYLSASCSLSLDLGTSGEGFRELTYAVGARVLSVTLGPELVALVASPAYPATDGAGSSGSTGGRAVRVLAVLRLWARARKVRVVHTDMLLQLLEGVVRALGEGIQTGGMHVAGLHVAIGQECGRRQGVVGGEAVERIGQHRAGWSMAESTGGYNRNNLDGMGRLYGQRYRRAMVGGDVPRRPTSNE